MRNERGSSWEASRQRRIWYGVSVVTATSAALTLCTKYPRLGAGAIVVAVCLAVWPFFVGAYRAVLSRLQGTGSRLKCFPERDTATPDMKRRMRRYSHLVFLGISQKTLSLYLDEALKESGEKELPWKVIDVFFAAEEAGHFGEPAEFEKNIRKSRQDIAAFLTSQEQITRLPNLEKVVFWQSTLKFGYGGSMFSHSVIPALSLYSPDLMYVVHYLPDSTPDTKTSLTLRILRPQIFRTRSNAGKLLNSYSEAFHRISANPRNLGQFSPTVWDCSVAEWSEFCKSYRGIEESMKTLINLAELKGNERALDVAAGTGEISRILLDALPTGNITLLDASPAMLRFAKSTLGGGSRVDYALCSMPTPRDSEIDILNRKFDIIFSHLSLSSFARNEQELEAFARWCFGHLSENGRIVLNAHNGMLMLLPSGSQMAWQNWQDPLRAKLSELLPHKLRRNPPAQPPKLKEEEIVKAFLDAGFDRPKREETSTSITMADRGKLWKVPAILDSIVDVRSLGIEKGKQIVDEVIKSVLHSSTMPRTVISWAFKKKQNARRHPISESESRSNHVDANESAV